MRRYLFGILGPMCVFFIPVLAFAEEDIDAFLEKIQKDQAVYDREQDTLRDLRSTRFQSLIDRIDSASATIHKISVEKELWKTEIQPLLAGEAGRYVSGDPETVRKIRSFIVLHQAAAEIDLAPKRERLTQLKAAVQKTIDQLSQEQIVAEDLDEKIAEFVNAQLQEIESVEKDLAGSRSSIKFLVSQGKKTAAPSEFTLQEELDRLEMEESLARARKIEEMRREKLEKLVEEEENARIAKVAAEKKAEIEKSRMDLQRIEEQSIKETLVARAENPKVKQTLAPFIEPGNVFLPNRAIFDGWPDAEWPKKNIPAPLSFGRLHQLGCLNPTEDGCLRLWKIATDRRNDRPKWSIQFNSKKDLEWVMAAQALLIELGPTLQELGMLQK